MSNRSGLGWAPNLRPEWPVVRLRLVARLGTGHTPDRTKPEYWESCDIPWVTAADLSRRAKPFSPLMDTRQKVSAVGLENSAAVLHPTGTVMLCRTASVGLVALIGRPMATTQAFVTWTPGPDLEPRYLMYVLNAMAPEWERLAYGSTHETIYMPDLESIKIPLPPLAEQRAISDYLDGETARVGSLIQKKQRLADLLDARSHSVVTEVLNRGTWHRPHLGQVARVESGTGFPHRYQGLSEGDFPFVKVGDLARSLDSRWVEDASNWVDRSTAEALGCRVAPIGAILFPKVGAALLGNQRRIVGVPAVFDNNLMAVASDVFEPRFLRFVLSTIDLGEMANPGPVPSINEDVVRALRVPVPTMSEQIQLADELDLHLDRHASLSEALHVHVERLAEHRRSLIAATVTGGIDASGVAA